MSKKKIGIIRGLMPRLAQAEFAQSFTRLNPVFITGEASSEVKKFCKKDNLKQTDLKLKPIYGLDPVSLILRKKTHQSWVGPDRLLEACGDLNVLETYELYHFFSGQAAGVARKLNIPLVTEVWTSFSTHPAYKLPPYALGVKKTILNTELFVARCRSSANALLELGIPERKISVIYSGVNISRFRPGKKEKNVKKIVLFVGELSAHKGVDLLLNIWGNDATVAKNLELWLVGKGNLSACAKQTKGVRVFGWVNYFDIPKLYQAADLFVAPSRDQYIGPFKWSEEFFSYVLMEAQASGLPAIVTRCGGMPEEVGDNNWIIPQNDPHALKKAILEAFSDENGLTQRGRKNRIRAEKDYDLEKQTGKLEKEILKLI